MKKLVELFEIAVDEKVAQVKESSSTYEEALTKVLKMQMGQRITLEEQIIGCVADAVKQKLTNEAWGQTIR